MVFARSKTRLNNIPTFKFGNIDLEQVEDYIYLGICFNWNGSFFKAKNDCMIMLQKLCIH